MALEQVIPQVQQELGALIKKPKLSTKLLSKPPFRFLHDIFFAVMRATGFGEGLYEEHELNGKTMKDRGIKIAFLEKTVANIESVLGEKLDVRPQKVVAGAEPENTNELLLALVRAATGGGGGGGGGKEDEGDGKESSAADDKAAAAEEQARREAEDRQRAEEEQRAAAAEAQARADAQEAARREQEEQAAAARAAEADAAAREAQAAAASGMDSGGGGGGHAEGGPLDGEIFVDESIERTQELVSHLIARPKMAPKLLNKPPFRFLHDTFTQISNATGFGAGLLLEGEENAKAIKDRNLKIHVLEKMLDCVGIHLGISLRAKPAKIVAGLEPELTREYMQYLAYAATRGDSSGAVQAVLDGQHMPSDEPQEDPADAVARDREEDDRRQAQEEAAAREAERQRQLADQRRREEEAAAAAAQRRDAEAAAARAEEERRAKEAAQYTGGGGADDGAMAAAGAGAGAGAGPGFEAAPSGGGGGGMRRLARPRTARRRPPRLKENAQEVNAAGATVPATAGRAVGIMKEGEDTDSDEEEAVPGAGSDGKVGELQADGAAGGAGKWTREILDQERKDNQTADEETPAAKKSGIRMGRIKAKGDKGTFSQVEVEQLRGFIQKLCQSTNPLGKCMDYVHEDVEMMKSELSSWTAEYKRRQTMLDEVAKRSDEALAPLKRELAAAEENIEQQTMKINGVKATIAKNDARIQELLRMVVSW